MPYSEIRSGLWQELYIFHLFSAESNSVGLSLAVTTEVAKPSRFSVSLFALLDTVHVFRLAVETCYSLGCDASSVAWNFYLWGIQQRFELMNRTSFITPSPFFNLNFLRQLEEPFSYPSLTLPAVPHPKSSS